MNKGYALQREGFSIINHTPNTFKKSIQANILMGSVVISNIISARASLSVALGLHVQVISPLVLLTSTLDVIHPKQNSNTPTPAPSNLASRSTSLHPPFYSK